MATNRPKTLACYPNLVLGFDTSKNSGLNVANISASYKGSVWWVCQKGSDHRWLARVDHRTNSGAGCPFCANRKASRTNSLAVLYPLIAKQLHPSKNGSLRAENIVASSTKKYWWKCDANPQHAWRAQVVKRTIEATNCPFCAGRMTSLENSLAAKQPALAAQWLSEKNAGLTPAHIVAGSGKKFWWRCDKGSDHIWQATPDSRIRRPACPFCSGKRVSSSNSLRTLFPDLCSQWHPEKNHLLRPEDVTSGSNKSVWWKCPNGDDHVWKASVCARTGTGKTGCPFCARQRLSKTNCLATLFPEVAREWHPELNDKLTAWDVMPGSSKSVWWRCSNNAAHNWQTPIRKRTYDKSDCHICQNLVVNSSNSLASKHTEIAKQWHPTNNAGKQPSEFVSGSQQVVWWKCSSGPDHEWEDRIANRTRFKSGCPFCINRRLSVTNSLAKHFPEIASQLHPTKNGDVTADKLVCSTKRKVWWQCSVAFDHVWKQSCSERIGVHKTGCPFCANKRLSVSNSLATVSPKLASEWDIAKNGSKTPDEVIAYSKVRAWWKCIVDPDHQWMARIAGRLYNQSACPWCNLAPRSKQEIYLAFELNRFFEFDLEKHKIPVQGRILDVDIVIDGLKLVVEYDGSYFHADKELTDLEKSRALSESGWKAIRVRERPLKAITENDVLIDARDAKSAAVGTLEKICSVFGMGIEHIQEYRNEKGLSRRKAADQYMKAKLFAKSAKSALCNGEL